MKKAVIALLCGSALFVGCDNRSLSSVAAPTSPIIQPGKVDTKETATPEQTIAELKSQPITALDLGLYRLRTEFAPDLDKRLRGQGLLPPAASDVSKAGFVSAGLSHAKVDPYGTLIEISVYTGDSGAAASEQTISRMQGLASKIVSVVRAYAGGPCASTDNPNLSTCQAAYYFYDWFERPSINGFNEPVVGRIRAGYNLYSLVQIRVYGQLKGAHTIVFVNCVGPTMRDEVKCDTSGD
jgi:hypothetical protein